MEIEKELLEKILVSQVLILSKLIAAEKKAKGVSSTSNYTREAMKLINQQKPSILRLSQ